MDAQEQLKEVTPLLGRLVPLRTFQEAHPVEETGDAYVAEIDIKSASNVVKLLGSKFPRDSAVNITHLRRFTKPEFLPENLRQRFPESEFSQSQRTIYILIPPPVPERTELESLLQPFAPVPAPPDPSSSSNNEAEDERCAIRIQPVQVPLQPPTSQEQAQTWTKTLWPTVYNAAARPASHSPPPMALAQTKASIEHRAGLYLSLAQRVAGEAWQLGRGRGVGVVVVDPAITTSGPGDSSADPMAAVVAVAGDARYYYKPDNDDGNDKSTKSSSSGPASQQRPNTYDPDNEGRPEHHAMMRAASMVSHKRLSSSSSSSSPPPLIPPSTPLESHFLSTTPIPPPSSGGYLCTSLDVYSTHEPCLCCAMGMLLSRFRAVVIPAKRKQKQKQESSSVGAALDAETGYGLHWRAELNWRAVGFEFFEDVDGDRDDNDEEEDGDDEGEFHP